MIAVTPASSAACGPSGNGKNASDARAAPRTSCPCSLSISNPTTPSRYNVRSIPTLLLFKNGQVAATKIGAEPKQKLVSWINTAIA